MNICNIITCQNGGVCKEEENDFWPFKCDCQPPFEGQFCEIGKKIELLGTTMSHNKKLNILDINEKIIFHIKISQVQCSIIFQVN